METLTLGQMLDVALGSSRAGIVNFEQLHNLLNGMLLHLGLRDLPVQESGEPLEGAEGSPFSASFLEELKQKVEANEKEITEVRALCQELREEVSEMKAEQSRIAEEFQNIRENLDLENFPNIMEDLRNQLLDTVMSAMKDMIQGQGSDWHLDPLSRHAPPWDGKGLIVIGNEITLLERSRTSTPRQGDTRPNSPLLPKAKTQGRGKDLLEENVSSHPVSFGANNMGENMGESDVGENMGLSDMVENMGENNVGENTGQNDIGLKGMGMNVGQNDMGRNMGRSDRGWKGMGWNVQWSDTGWNDMGQADMEQDGAGQIKDEEIKIKVSKPEAHSRPLDVPPVMTDVGEIKHEGIKRRISKAPLHVQRKGLDGSLSALGTHPGAPGTHLPVQQRQSVRGHSGSQSLLIPAESVAGTSSRLPTYNEGRRGAIFGIESLPAEAGLMLLKAPSSEYSPCDHIAELSGQHSKILSPTPPASPGVSGRPPHSFKRYQTREHREQAAEGYARGSPKYCGGQHTSTFPGQPMEPLLPDPNKPGVFELVGKDGSVYRGRTPQRMNRANNSSLQK